MRIFFIRISKQRKKIQSVNIRVCLETDEKKQENRLQTAQQYPKSEEGGQKSRKEHDRVLPSGFPFLSQTSVGGGIPVASHMKATGLLTVSLINSSSGPSIFGGTRSWMEAVRVVCLGNIFVNWFWILYSTMSMTLQYINAAENVECAHHKR